MGTEIPRTQAEQEINQRALGVGEDHTSGGGRSLALSLIRARLVSKLFTELPRTKELTIDEFWKNAGDNTKWTDAQRRQKRTSLEKMCADRWSGDISIEMGEVVYEALLHGATVYCCGPAAGADPDTNVDGLNIQDKHAADRIKAVTGWSRAKSLVLYGGIHFMNWVEGQNCYVVETRPNRTNLAALLPELNYVMFK